MRRIDQRQGISAALFLGAAALFTGGLARAEGADGPGREGAAAVVSRSAGAGSFLPLTQAAAVQGQGAHGVATGGYDGARGAAMFEAAAEVGIWGPLAVRGGAVYTGSDRRLRPSLGARIQALTEARHGIDGALGVFYRPEGLTEPEGEVETVLSAGAHLGRTYLLANVVYGQDPEGNERDGEVRLAGQRPVGERLFLGIDGRLRFALGTPPAGSRAAGEPTLDLMLGPAATVVVGRLALLVHGGASALRAHSAGAYGAFLVGGLGTSF
jgi:hypothetical protein